MLTGITNRQQIDASKIEVLDVGISRLIINPLECFCGIEGHAALNRNPGPEYNTLLLRLIAGDLLSACPHSLFHTLPSFLDSRVALSNSFPDACVPSRGAVCAIFMVVFGITRPGHEPASYRMIGGHASL